MNTTGYDLPPWAWVLVAVLLLGQATWIFLDAGKRGERKFLWGLFGLLNVPSSLIVYLIVTRTAARKVACPSCGAKIQADARFCPACGSAQAARTGKPGDTGSEG